MKLILKVIKIICVALVIEICIFNFEYIKDLTNNNLEKNIRYSLKDSKIVNWEKLGDAFTSQIDPMIIFSNVNTYIKTIKIITKTKKKIPYIDLFYTNSNNLEFNGEMLLKIREAKEDVNFLNVNQNVKDIRIDLGDEAGLNLQDLSIIINPVEFDFNISRVIAIVFIYFSSVGLFVLQKSPNYDVLIQDEGGEDRGRSD